jgi:hypothetical protein
MYKIKSSKVHSVTDANLTPVATLALETSSGVEILHLFSVSHTAFIGKKQTLKLCAKM